VRARQLDGAGRWLVAGPRRLGAFAQSPPKCDHQSGQTRRSAWTRSTDFGHSFKVIRSIVLKEKATTRSDDDAQKAGQTIALPVPGESAALAAPACLNETVPTQLDAANTFKSEFHRQFASSMASGASTK
jgi:hypothetical protein